LTIKNIYYKTTLDYNLETYDTRSSLDLYVRNPQFDVLEKLYDENYKQDNQLVNLEYLKLKNKYKIFQLILFRNRKRYGKI
jgi:hypothetical protein